MKTIPSKFALAEILCVSLLFSCTSDLEMPPPPLPPDELSSSSEMPSSSSPAVLSSSSDEVSSSSSSSPAVLSSSSVTASSSSSSSSGNSSPTTCQYQPEWCNGISLNDIIILVTDVSKPQPTGSPNKCLFFKNIGPAGLGFSYKITTKINNVSLSPPDYYGNTIPLSIMPAKIDGGYYVYLPNDFPTASGSNWINVDNGNDAVNDGTGPNCDFPE